MELHADHYPFQTWAWLSSWHETIGFAHGWTPAVLLLERGDDSGDGSGLWRALLPLGVQGRRPFRRLAWMGEGVSDYHGALIVPSRTDASVHSDGDDADCPADSVCISASTEAFPAFSSRELLDEIRSLAANLRCDLIELDRNPAAFPHSGNPLAGGGFALLHYMSHQLRIPADMDAFLAQRFSAKERYNLRRASKKLAEQGRLEFRVAATPEEQLALTDCMIAFKKERYRAIGARDNFEDPSFAGFYRKAASRPDLRVHASALHLDGDIIALHWGIRDRESMYYLMPAFAAGRLEHYSPGLVFLQEFIGECRREGLDTLDFTIGDEDYKRKWRTNTMELYRYRSGTSLSGALVTALRNAADRLRSSPLREPFVHFRNGMRRKLQGKNS